MPEERSYPTPLPSLLLRIRLRGLFVKTTGRTSRFQARSHPHRIPKPQRDGDGSHVKNLRYALLKNPWNLTAKQGASLAELQVENKRLHRAYLLKESFAEIFRGLPEPEPAERALRDWLCRASRSRFNAFVKVARTIRRHLSGIVAYFRTGYTTSKPEGANTKARLATRMAYGFHGVDAVLASIELHCSGVQITLPHVR